MKSNKCTLVALVLFMLLIVPLRGNASEKYTTTPLSNFLQGEMLETMNGLGYMTAEQFVSVAITNPQMLADELGIDREKLMTIVRKMKIAPRIYEKWDIATNSGEFPLGVILEYTDVQSKYGYDLETEYEDYGVTTTMKRDDYGRSVNLIPECPPIRDQQNRGTCVGFAMTALLEFVYGSNEDLSEQFGYWACKKEDFFPMNLLPGSTPKSAYKVLKNRGVCLEQTWPYNPDPVSSSLGDAQGPPPDGAEEEALEYTYQDVKLLNRPLIGGFDIELVISTLDDGYIVFFAVPVYDSWYNSSEVRRTGNITMPLSSDSVAGGHAMNLVGYVDNAQYPGGGFFLVRNSWGSRWGTESTYGTGYGTIPYAYINKDWNGGIIVTN